MLIGKELKQIAVFKNGSWIFVKNLKHENELKQKQEFYDFLGVSPLDSEKDISKIAEDWAINHYAIL